MNSNEQIKIARAKYIQKRVNSVFCKTTEIRRIAAELFISEKTVKRDLKK